MDKKNFIGSKFSESMSKVSFCPICLNSASNISKKITVKSRIYCENAENMIVSSIRLVSNIGYVFTFHLMRSNSFFGVVHN